MEIKEKVELFREMISCNDDIYSSCYDSTGMLLFTNADKFQLYHNIFVKTNCMSLVQEYAKTDNRPVFLSIRLGLVWMVAFEPVTEEESLIHVLGPMYNMNTSLNELRRAIRPWEQRMPLEDSHRLLEAIQNLPVVSYSDACRYALMLHYCLTGEKLQLSDISVRHSSSRPQYATASPEPKDSHPIWLAEKRLLRMVKEGNLNYRSALNQSGDQLGTPWLQSGGSALEQSVLSQIIQTALCAHAAIEGGLSPDTAYTLANNHILNLQACSTVSDIQAVSLSMYVDFISRVHKYRADASISPDMRNCCDYIMMHIEEPLTLTALAEQMGYTPYYFSRRFKREMGCALTDYVKASKIEHSKTLLETTEMNIAEIADKLHFASRTHYSNIFHSLTGMSPAQWRKQH